MTDAARIIAQSANLYRRCAQHIRAIEKNDLDLQNVIEHSLQLVHESRELLAHATRRLDDLVIADHTHTPDD